MKKPKINPNLIIKLLSRKSYGKLLVILVMVFGFWIYNEIKFDETGQLSDNEQILRNDITRQEIKGTAKAGDGDSITLTNDEIKYKVRLVNIDAPEYKQKCLNKDNYEYFCGQVSAQFLKKMVDGKRVICRYEKKDMYNRFLGNCFLGEMNINEELLKNGMVITYSFDKIDPRLQEIENQARIKKIGIWQGAFLEPSKYRKKERKS